MKKIVTINIIKIYEGDETIETPYLLLSDELNPDEKLQLHEDCNLEFDDLMKVNEITDIETRDTLKRFIDGNL